MIQTKVKFFKKISLDLVSEEMLKENKILTTSHYTQYRNSNILCDSIRSIISVKIISHIAVFPVKTYQNYDGLESQSQGGK